MKKPPKKPKMGQVTKPDMMDMGKPPKAMKGKKKKKC